MRIKEAALRLQINESTLKKYLSDFEIEVRKDSSGYRVFTDEDISLLQEIIRLRDKHGIKTIQKKLEVGISGKAFDSSEVEGKADISGNDEKAKDDITSYQLIVSELKDTLKEELSAVLEQSEKYSRATYEIGKLQAEKAALEDKLKLITDGNNKDVASLQKELNKSSQEAERVIFEKDQMIEKLKLELEKEKNKSWLEKIFRKKA